MAILPPAAVHLTGCVRSQTVIEMLFVMFVTTEYLVHYCWLTDQYDCPVNVCSLYETYTTAGGR